MYGEGNINSEEELKARVKTELDEYFQQNADIHFVNKVAEGRPHVVDMIKNNEIALVINTVEEKRTAIHDSRTIRTSALAARVTTYTTIAGAEAAVEGMAHLNELHVYDLQGLHQSLH